MDVKRLFHGLRPYFCDLSGRRHVMDQKLDNFQQILRPAALLATGAAFVLLAGCAGELGIGKTVAWTIDNKGLIERCIGQHDENMAAFRK